MSSHHDHTGHHAKNTTSEEGVIVDGNFILLQFNCKLSPNRYEQVLADQENGVNGDRALVIAFSDLHVDMAFRNDHGYHVDMPTIRPLTEADHPNQRKKRQKRHKAKVEKKQQKAARRVASGAEPLPDTDDNELPEEPSPVRSRVMFCVDKSIRYNSWKVIYDDDENQYLAATLFIETTMGEVAIHIVHNPNTKDQTFEVEPLMRRLHEPGLHIVVGDFNLHHESWAGPLFKRHLFTHKARELKTSMSAAGLELVTKPGTITYTRSGQKTLEHDRNGEPASSGNAAASSDPATHAEELIASTSSVEGDSGSTWVDRTASCIDLTFISKQLRPRVRSWGVDQISDLDESDHRCIRTVIDLEVFVDETKYYNFQRMAKGAYQAFINRNMPIINDYKLDNKDDVNNGITALCMLMLQARDEFVPSHTAHKPKVDPKPVSKDADLETLEQLQAPDVEHRVRNQRCRSKAWLLRLQQKIKERNAYAAQKSQTPNGIYTLAKAAARRAKPRVVDDVPILDIDTNGVTYETNEEKADCLRHKLWPETSDDAPPETPMDDLDPDRHSFEIADSLEEHQVKNAIKKLVARKAPGPDQVTTDGIRLASDAITPFLTRLFRACMTFRFVPNAFKRATTIIIRKPGKATYNSPKSWRPIALLSVIGKIYERILNDIIVLAAIEHDLLPGTQYGAPGGNTTRALQDMLAVFYDAYASRKLDTNKLFKRRFKVSLLGLDMASAFDTVPRIKVIQELARKGYPQWLLEIIHSFLSNRTTSLKLPRSHSEEFYVNIGIPQGSPLSPILFLFFAAPLLERIHARRLEGITIRAFAYVDDTYLVVTSKSYARNCEGLSEVHKDIMDWSAETGITFSPHKYNLMHIRDPGHTGPPPTDLPDIPGVKDNPDLLKDNFRVLGVIIDNQLSWEHHVAHIEESVERSLRYMWGIGTCTTGSVMKGARQYYVGAIRPIISYACPAWYLHRDGRNLEWSFKMPLVRRLESLQYKCLRRVSGAINGTSHNVIEKEAYIEPIRIFLHRTVITWRASSFKVSPISPYSVESIPAETQKLRTANYWLNVEARVLICNARSHIQYPEDYKPKRKRNKRRRKPKAKKSKEGTSKSKEPYNWKTVWLSRNRRKAVIKRLAHKDANKSCVEQWDQYKRERAGRHAGHHRPQAIDEPWGPKVLKYYDRMTRAQSTMFFQLRTEYIGLNHHLNKIKILDRQDPNKVISAACSCGYGRQTVSHLFLDCPDLCVAREHLRFELLHLNMEDMLTSYGKFAADWAISYFKLGQFNSVRDDSMFAKRKAQDELAHHPLLRL